MIHVTPSNSSMALATAVLIMTWLPTTASAQPSETDSRLKGQIEYERESVDEYNHSSGQTIYHRVQERYHATVSLRWDGETWIDDGTSTVSASIVNDFTSQGDPNPGSSDCQIRYEYSVPTTSWLEMRLSDTKPPVYAIDNPYRDTRLYPDYFFGLRPAGGGFAMLQIDPYVLPAYRSINACGTTFVLDAPIAPSTWDRYANTGQNDDPYLIRGPGYHGKVTGPLLRPESVDFAFEDNFDDTQRSDWEVFDGETQTFVPYWSTQKAHRRVAITGVLQLADGKPKASFTFVVKPNGAIEFDATGSTGGGSEIASYEWEFDDKSETSILAAPLTSHRYDFVRNTGAIAPYRVSLVVVDSEGQRSDPATHEVDVCKPDQRATNGREFASLVRCVEETFPQFSPRHVLSFMRQFYYGKPWSRRKDPLWRHIIPCQIDFQGDPSVALASKLKAALTDTGNGGDPYDYGHLFPVLEAAQCPSETTTFQKAGVSVEVDMPNYLLAGWPGDLASAVGFKVQKEIVGGITLPWAYVFGDTGIRAGYSDLRADIDAHVLAVNMSSRLCGFPPSPSNFHEPLSRTLYNYFPDLSGEEMVSGDYLNRMSCFNHHVSAYSSTGSSMKETSARKVGRQLVDFASLYAAYISDEFALLAVVSFIPEDSRTRKAVTGQSEELAQRFLSWLATQ